MRPYLWISLILTTFCGAVQAQEWENSAFSKDPYRQFDFWVGEWSVNLRIRQPDFTWKDSVQAVTKVYPILQGKALLELWNSEPIKGYSLRYYDPAKMKWVLWLNWPQPNHSGSAHLEGEFRHGRGEFFATRTNPAGEEVISRYTFSDVSPTSLRWDDAYSNDGGNTWRNNWIMEFSRKADEPSWPDSDTAHTYESGGRCSLEAFRAYEFLAGAWQGEVEQGIQTDPANLRAYKVLDGCAVIALLYSEGRNRNFWHITFNNQAKLYELTRLDNNRNHPAAVLYGELQDDRFELKTSRQAPQQQKFILIHDNERISAELLLQDGEDWSRVYRATLRRH